MDKQAKLNYKKCTVKDINMLNIKEWGNMYHFNTSQKKAKVASLISDKLDFRVKNIIKDKDNHFI